MLRRVLRRLTAAASLTVLTFAVPAFAEEPLRFEVDPA